MKEYETVIGLEVHVELATKTKIFCGCSTAFGGAPNTHVCPVCSGMPGSLPVLNKQEVKTGDAIIRCTLDDGGIKEYKIRIDKIDLNEQAITKNLLLTVTDPELLEKTGGIVQGMSGSPILQDGKIIGAVTHVFVSDSSMGYGIFIENMVE